MIRARQHIPSFVDGYEPEEAEAASLDELLRVSWISRWMKPGMGSGQAFFRWSLADPDTLMAEYDEGRHWWVVAFLSSDEPIQLPKWEAK